MKQAGSMLARIVKLWRPPTCQLASMELDMKAQGPEILEMWPTKEGMRRPKLWQFYWKMVDFNGLPYLSLLLMAILMGNMVINDQFLEVITCMFHGMDFTSFRCFRGEEGFVFGVLMGGWSVNCDRYGTIWLGIIHDVHSFSIWLNFINYSQLRVWPILTYYELLNHTECRSHTAGLGLWHWMPRWRLWSWWRAWTLAFLMRFLPCWLRRFQPTRTSMARHSQHLLWASAWCGVCGRLSPAVSQPCAGITPVLDSC